MIYYLYIKTHNKTRLKYLGKTITNPYKYLGSGLYWLRHLKVHGKDISTEIIGQYETEGELKEAGLYYSNLWNIVESDEWANLGPEKGSDGAGINFYKGRIVSDEIRLKISLANKGRCWNKGRKCPEISNGLKGYIKSDEHRKKLGLAKLGTPNPTKGMHHIMTKVRSDKGKKRGPNIRTLSKLT